MSVLKRISSAATITAIHTSGHAEHHVAYGIDNDVVFTGDIGGLRMPGYDYVRLPLVPPELHLEKWRASLEKLLAMNFKRIAPTHFALFNDAEMHLQAAIAAVDETSLWLEEVMPAEPTSEELGQKYEAWVLAQAQAEGVSEETLKIYEIANPLYMASVGMARRVDGGDRQISNDNLLPILDSNQFIFWHSKKFTPEHLHPVLIDACRTGNQLFRVEHMRRTDGVDANLRALLRQPSCRTGMVKMNVA